jgi:quinol monooxygenase YgiN
MIYVVATVDLMPGTRSAFLAAFKQNVPLVLAEAGCISYAPVIDAPTGFPTQANIGPDKVCVIEQWASLDALKAHAVAPHMKTYRFAVKEMVKSTSLQVFDPA